MSFELIRKINCCNVINYTYNIIFIIDISKECKKCKKLNFNLTLIRNTGTIQILLEHNNILLIRFATVLSGRPRGFIHNKICASSWGSDGYVLNHSTFEITYID